MGDDASILHVVEALAKKTRRGEVAWRRHGSSRRNEFRVVLDHATVTVDAWGYDGDSDSPFAELVIYNDSGRKIEHVAVEPGGAMFRPITVLHEAVVEAVDKPRQTMREILEQLDRPGRVGDAQSEGSPIISDDDIPF